MGLRGRYVTLLNEVAKRRPSTILEIGTHCGNSAIRMVDEAKKYNDDVFYYGFDVFDWGDQDFMKTEFNGKRSATFGKTKLRLDKANINHKLIIGDTKNTLKKFSPDRYIDFVFIDGGHSIETIESDWNYINRLMGKQTVVIFDDYYENRDDFGCKNLIDNLQKEKNYKIEKLDPLEVVEKNNIELRLVKVTKCQ
jgi:predicted O-methyltransferase YrrM